MIRRLLLVLDSSGDGARSLLDLARWAATAHDVTITAVVLDADDEARTLDGVTTVRRPTPTIGVVRATAELTGRPGLARRAARIWRRRVLADAPTFDVVVAGSAEALMALDEMADPRPPVVAHLPLLDETWSGRPRPADLARRLSSVALTVVPAEPVARWATRDRAHGGLGLDPRRVRHHPGPVDPPSRHPRPGPDAAALVVGCGPVGWRAGTDLFAAVAGAVGAEVDGRTVHWTWIGDDDVDGTAADVRDDLDLRGLRHRVRITPDGPERADRLAAADLLLVTGRVDPYPLPAVQAALAGTPVAGFTPGTALLGEAGHDGRRVDRLDVDALADQVRELLTHPDRGRLLAGDLARAAASATTPLAAASLWADIEDAVAAVTAPAPGDPAPPVLVIRSDGRASDLVAGAAAGDADRHEGER
ncbi:glycosyltransferase family 4 protein [Iamia sp. SCSIO 61187]|uniref:glycosyltransferase n=1 Tax=Iamia sp. SCSIO 61187 TaxID=2722752 RepID=UPI001C6261FD|nr:glycosyltransferase [Iamia sp. SCSIO 61187]QYG92097.1 glycosyltransferase family 4 protein [Iamia sp. SCSIO 61187]